MRLRWIIGVLVLCASPWALSAQDCRELKEGSAAWAGCTAYESFQIEEKALGNAYRNLTAAMNKPAWIEARKLLIASQQAWLSYRKRECQFVNVLAGGAGGMNAMTCQADMTRDRTQYLARVLDQFK